MTAESLSEIGQNIYFHLNHPIKWVRLVGLIVSFEIISNRFILIFDDFSGTTLELTCIRKAPPPTTHSTTTSGVKTAETSEQGNGFGLYGPSLSTEVKLPLAKAGITGITAEGNEVDLSNVDIGSVVKVKGGIGEFRGQKQILLERIWVVRSTSEEAAAWAENLEFRRDILVKPWIVAEEEIRAARREAEGLKRDKKSERRKRKNVKERRHGLKSEKQSERSAVVNEDLRMRVHKSTENNERKRRKDAEQKSIDEKERKAKEQEETRRIAHEDARRRERIEALKKMKDEQERKRRVEEEEQRKVEEERERLATARRRRNEAREKALRELGAGR